MSIFVNFIVFMCTSISILGMETIEVPDNERWNHLFDSHFNATENSFEYDVSANEYETASISVYYESLCPDCRRFFMTQLLSVVVRLFHNVNVHLVPYGHAKSTRLANGTIQFECQHGPAECYGNKLHACAIDKLRQPSWAASLFTICLTAQSDRGSNDRALVNCGQLMSVQVDSIRDCAKGLEGDQLLDNYGNETKKYNPYSVPFVVLNNSSDNQDELVGNLLDAVCKVFHTKPSGCSRY